MAVVDAGKSGHGKPPAHDGVKAPAVKHGQDVRAEQWAVLRGLLPFVWPAGRPDLRLKVVWAFALLVLVKLITVAMPVIYKAATDWLATHVAAAATPAGGAILAGAMLIVAYGMSRIMMAVFTQVRDVLFMHVALNAVRQLNNRTFRHLHRLSLRFHIERRTGGLNRVIQRGTQAVELIIRMGALNAVPTALELVLLSALLWYYFGGLIVLIVLVMVAAYIGFSIVASEWRIGIRREMNESDTDANTKAVDSLLNFETVKYFGNEGLEARRFDASMQRYEKASLHSYWSLGALNAGQAVIFTIGLTLAMILAARGVVVGTHTIGDFVMINAMLIQLYIPLNFMGMIYREIKQGLVDLETMFTLLGEHPEIEDRPGAVPLQVKGGDDPIRARLVRLRSGAADPARRIVRGSSRQDGGDRRPVGRRQVDHQPDPVPLLRHRRRPRDDRRPGHQRRHAGIAARRDRRRAAGHRAVQRHHPLQHPLRPCRCDRRGGVRGSEAGADRRLHQSLARRLPRRWSASAA